MNNQIQSLKDQTVELLDRAGEGRLSIRVWSCRSGSQCNTRGVCPHCSWTRQLTRETHTHAALKMLGHDRSYAAVTLAPSSGDVAVSGLRDRVGPFGTAASHFLKNAPGVTGTMLQIESIPSKVAGQPLTRYDHLHGHALVVLGQSDEGRVIDHLLDRADDYGLSVGHIELVDRENAPGWAAYSLKAHPSAFADKLWRPLLDEPSTFLERARQLKGQRLFRASGTMHPGKDNPFLVSPHTVRLAA